MNEAAKRISIIGLGLIGGSLGMALKKGLGEQVVITGFSRRLETLDKAQTCGAIDKAAASVVSAVSGAHVVVIATPVMTIKSVLAQIAGHLPAGCIVTDVGSTKAKVMGWAEQHLGGVDFIGGHPMAGKEKHGIDEAKPDLFRDCTYCIIPSASASDRSVKSLISLVESVGARPMLIDAESHDKYIAGISHLPLVLSAALVSTTMSSPSWPEMSRLAASGYRDLSRLASGHPEMSRDICLTNRDEIIRWIDLYVEELRRYRYLIQGDDAKLEKAFAEAQRARERWLREGKR